MISWPEVTFMAGLISGVAGTMIAAWLTGRRP